MKWKGNFLCVSLHLRRREKKRRKKNYWSQGTSIDYDRKFLQFLETSISIEMIAGDTHPYVFGSCWFSLDRNWPDIQRHSIHKHNFLLHSHWFDALHHYVYLSLYVWIGVYWFQLNTILSQLESTSVRLASKECKYLMQLTYVLENHFLLFFDPYEERFGSIEMFVLFIHWKWSISKEKKIVPPTKKEKKEKKN